MFDIIHQERGAFPTPRNIIAYVNDIAAIWNQWGDKIPVAHIALYVLQRRLIEGNPATIRNSASTNPRLIRVVGEGAWHRDLAALHFNVEPKHAYQILLGQDIEKIATGTNADAFVELAGQLGFAEVFPDTAQQWVDQWASDGGDLLARLARNMSDTRIVEGQFRETWLRMEDALLHLKECDTSKAENYTGLALLVENLPTHRATVAAARLISWFSQNLPEEGRDAALGREWFKFTARVHAAVSKVCGAPAAEDLLNSTKLPMGTSFAIGVCGESSKSDTIEYDSFQDENDAVPLSDATLELVKTDPRLLAEVVAVRPWFISKEFWLEATNRVCDRLHAEKLDAPTRQNLLNLLSNFRAAHDANDVGKPRIAQLANDGTLIWHAMRALAEKDLTTVARAVWLNINTTDGMHPLPNPGNHPHLGDINVDHQTYTSYLTEIADDGEVAKELARLISQSGTFLPWMKLASSNPNVKVFGTHPAKDAVDQVVLGF